LVLKAFILKGFWHFFVFMDEIFIPIPFFPMESLSCPALS